jgi:plasmid stability protein
VASITIRNLDEETKQRLRLRAAHRRHSMEQEARLILRGALEAETEPVVNLAEAIHARFRRLGGLDLELPPRAPMREPPALKSRGRR